MLFIHWKWSVADAGSNRAAPIGGTVSEGEGVEEVVKSREAVTLAEPSDGGDRDSPAEGMASVDEG